MTHNPPRRPDDRSSAEAGAAADVAAQHAALDAALDDLQARLNPILDALRDQPDADAASLAALSPLLAERQRLLTQQATLWRRWRAEGGSLLWLAGAAAHPVGAEVSASVASGVASAAVSERPASAGGVPLQRVAVRVLHKPTGDAAATEATEASEDVSESVNSQPPPPAPSPTSSPARRFPAETSAATSASLTSQRFEVTPDLRATLQSALAGALDTRAPDDAATTPHLDILQALLRLAGPPVFLTLDGAHLTEEAWERLHGELGTLRRLVEPHPLASLQRLPRAMQAHFLGMVIARLRHLQDIPGDHHPAVSALFPHLETFSRLHQPGPVNGFSRKHTPQRGAWLKDARFHHLRLSELLQPPSDLPDNPEHLLTLISTRLTTLAVAPDAIPQADTPSTPDSPIPLDLSDTPEQGDRADAELTALCKRFIHVASDNDPRLLRLLADHLDRLSGKTRKRVKKALDRAARHKPSPPTHPPSPDAPSDAASLTAAPDAASDADAPEGDRAAPPDALTTPTPADDLDAPDFLSRWAWRAHTTGKRAIIVGGEDQREDIRARAAAAFGFATLEWHPANHPKRLETLAKRAKQGSLDLVILLKRFISHRVEDLLVKPCKKHGVRYLYLEQGYAPDSLRRAIERHLPPEPP